mgnify:CR=1 FL=1
MTKEELTMELHKREVVKKQLNSLREDGHIPAVIHNHGKESILVQGDEMALTKLFVKAGKSQPVTITVGKKDYYTLIKDVDVSPTKNRLRHIVFQSVRRGEKIHAEVHVSFTEDMSAPAEQKGLLVLKQLDTVEVNAIPSKLPDVLNVDPSSLKDVGDRLAVKDIILPEGVEMLTDPESQIASVEVPKDQEAEADAAAAGLAEDAETTTEVPTAEQEEDIEKGDETGAPAEDKPAEESK